MKQSQARRSPQNLSYRQHTLESTVASARVAINLCNTVCRQCVSKGSPGSTACQCALLCQHSACIHTVQDIGVHADTATRRCQHHLQGHISTQRRLHSLWLQHPVLCLCHAPPGSLHGRLDGARRSTQPCCCYALAVALQLVEHITRKQTYCRWSGA
jgi:hypothetical protein